MLKKFVANVWEKHCYTLPIFNYFFFPTLFFPEQKPLWRYSQGHITDPHHFTHYKSHRKGVIKVTPLPNAGQQLAFSNPNTFVSNLNKMRLYFAILLLFTFSFVFGQGNYHVTNYSLVINGTSNLHAWQSKANEVRANGTFQADATSLKGLQSLSVEIPVKSIKSAKGSIMDNKTYDALKANSHPNIQYKLEKVSSLNSKNGGIELNASGYLTIAGSTKRIDLYVQGWLTADGSITFKGSKKLKMSDFGISPPTALMGTLTTGDEVEIVFQVSLKQ